MSSPLIWPREKAAYFKSIVQKSRVSCNGRIRRVKEKLAPLFDAEKGFLAGSTLDPYDSYTLSDSGTVNLLSRSYGVHMNAGSNILSGHNNGLEINIQLPLHARYQSNEYSLEFQEILQAPTCSAKDAINLGETQETSQSIGSNPKKPSEFGVNDENKAPLPPSADASVDYIPSENLKSFLDLESNIQVLDYSIYTFFLKEGVKSEGQDIEGKKLSLKANKKSSGSKDDDVKMTDLEGSSNASGESSVTTSQEGVPSDKETRLTGIYDLVAVLTHKGRSADSGHYVAWVKQESGKWIEFDDDNPILQREEDIVKLSGGDWHMAYICMYKARTVSM
ncbi:hypothetical protein CRYUN_Cryun13aG0038900 [Craigia yunnanensis]